MSDQMLGTCPDMTLAVERGRRATTDFTYFNMMSIIGQCVNQPAWKNHVLVGLKLIRSIFSLNHKNGPLKGEKTHYTPVTLDRVWSMVIFPYDIG